MVNGDQAYEVLRALEYGLIVFDTYCPECGQSTTWQTEPLPSERRITDLWKAGDLSYQSTSTPASYLQAITLTCARQKLLHEARFAVALMDPKYSSGSLGIAKLEKLGQFPSFADISASEVDAYRSLVDARDLTELKRATGLAAHGIGIGSFVYLRRIFERLVKEAGEQVPGLDLGKFAAMRMEDKLEAVTGFVPDWMVKNRKLYSILSLGLHELTEETCQAAFPTVKAGILSLLEQHAEHQRRELRAKEAAGALEKLQQILGTGE